MSDVVQGLVILTFFVKLGIFEGTSSLVWIIIYSPARPILTGKVGKVERSP